MKSALALALLAAAVACSRPPARPARPKAPVKAAAAASTSTTDIQTIDNTDNSPAVMDPPPTLTDEGGAPPKPTVGLAQPEAPPPPNPADEALRASLPFSPAIALDPVDGQKISIRASTPTFEYKGKLFYFSNEANKRMFMANPEAYMKGIWK